MSIADKDIPATALFDTISDGLKGMSDKEKKENIKKVNGIFEMRVKKGSKEGIYTIDLKKEGTVYQGNAKPKADVTISLDNDTFQQVSPNIPHQPTRRTAARAPMSFTTIFVDTNLSLLHLVFPQLADGKLNGQKAFMSGKLKVKGNIMLATKLDTVLKGAQAKL
ncbi:BQ2448_7514 [Microbotryum intermedium]|uniref:BQ2448_7514 protein n=1 Tax=Microbotryum intermedium TaxID=269621 RepID=A0A238FQW2_9BASI|nr:BQ2448_7514 [Microbotryum intermedium]